MKTIKASFDLLKYIKDLDWKVEDHGDFVRVIDEESDEKIDIYKSICEEDREEFLANNYEYENIKDEVFAQHLFDKQVEARIEHYLYKLKSMAQEVLDSCAKSDW